MKIFACVCEHILFFESVACTRCGRTLAFLPDRRVVSPVESDDDGGALSDRTRWRAAGDDAAGPRYRPCRNDAPPRRPLHLRDPAARPGGRAVLRGGRVDERAALADGARHLSSPRAEPGGRAAGRALPASEPGVPRSVTCCLLGIRATLPRLPAHPEVEQELERTLAMVQNGAVTELVESGLNELMDEIQKGLDRIHEAVTSAFFRVAS